MHKNLDKFYCSKICFDTNISFMQTTPHTENFGGNGPQKHWNFLLESRKQWDLLLLEKKGCKKVDNNWNSFPEGSFFEGKGFYEWLWFPN